MKAPATLAGVSFFRGPELSKDFTLPETKPVADDSLARGLAELLTCYSQLTPLAGSLEA